MNKISIKFRAIIALAVICICICCILFFSCSRSSRQIRNVLLISIDTCRADRLSCYGYKSETTLNIDAVAAEGILFENTISPVPMTLPAHSSMLTGTIPPYHGIHDNRDYKLSGSSLTLPEILGANGFTTGAVISAFVLDSKFGTDQGFETYNDEFQEPHLAFHRISERKGDEATRFAIEWLEKQKDERFFFFLHYYDPHYEYAAPEPFASKFADDPYAGEIAYVDYCIGRVLTKLKELGLYDSTLIIITSDHGKMLGEHGERDHSYFIYQSAIKVPMIFKLPGHNKHRRVSDIVGIVDIVPTICGMLDIELPKNIHGHDLSSAFTSAKPTEPDRHLYCGTMFPTNIDANPLFGIVSDRFKYILTTRPELYDLVNDPEEADNLIDKQPQRAKIMKDKLLQILELSANKDSTDRKMDMDAETLDRLQSLGYVGGRISEDFKIDQNKEDPKDLIEYYIASEDAFTFFHQKDYEQAKISYQKLLLQRPQFSATYFMLAQIASKQSDFDQAVTRYREFIKIDPSQPTIYHNLGLVLTIQEKWDQAIDCFEKTLALDPEKNQSISLAYNNMGLRRTDKGLYDNAIRDFNRAIELSPANADFYKNRASACLRKGDYDQAISDFNRAIETNPEIAGIFTNRGTAYLRKGDYDRAISDFDRVIETNPEVAGTFTNRGFAYLKKDDSEQAISDFSRAIELDRTNASFYYNRGLAYKTREDNDRAIADFNQAIKLNPEYARAYRNRGATYQLKGDYTTALRDFEKAIKLNPADTTARNNLNQLLRAKEAATD